MKTLDFKAIFTVEQMARVIELYCTTKTTPHKAILTYINSEPSILKACETHQVFPPYLAYLIQFQLNASPCNKAP